MLEEEGAFFRRREAARVFLSEPSIPVVRDPLIDNITKGARDDLDNNTHQLPNAAELMTEVDDRCALCEDGVVGSDNVDGCWCLGDVMRTQQRCDVVGLKRAVAQCSLVIVTDQEIDSGVAESADTIEDNDGG